MDRRVVLSTPANKICTIEPLDYTGAISTGTDITLEFITFDKPVEASFIKIMRRFLSFNDTLYIRDVLITILKELITNAVKGNSKRLYFRENNLRITDPEDYKKGMVNFKNDVLSPENPLFVRLNDTNFKVRVIFSKTNGKQTISVWNNIPIVPEELAKINSRISKAYEYNDITEAFTDLLDDSEGAGLGLIMAMMVFKNAGFPREDFHVISTPTDTSFAVSFQAPENRVEIHTKVTDEISRAIDALPSFPENIQKLQELCAKENASMQEVSDFIKRDPSLATSILKLANSAGYATIKRINSIDEAVKIIGFNGIKTVALASAVEKIIQTKFREFRSIWDESFKKAFYAYTTAVQLKYNNLADVAYLAALLSKLGKIILLSVDRYLVETLVKIAGVKHDANMDILEEMTIGISQTTIGALVSRKWNFDESLSYAIGFHRKPHLAAEQYKVLVYIVYLSHVFSEMETGQYRFEIIDDDVLSFFKISDEAEFNKLHQSLIKAYSQEHGKK